MQTVPIKDHNHLVRDISSKAILNTNANALKLYEEQKRKFDEITELKNEVKEIKSLLLSLLGKQNDNSDNR